MFKSMTITRDDCNSNLSHIIQVSNYTFVFSLMICSLSGGLNCKESSYSAGDPGSIPGSGRSPGEENGNPLQYSCLENSMDSGAWWAIVHGFAKSWTPLGNSYFHFIFTLVQRSQFHLDEWNSVIGGFKIEQIRKKWSILKFSLSLL